MRIPFGKSFPATIVLLTGFVFGSFAQLAETKPEEIRWMSFTDAVKESEKVPKKIFIDVFTKWCGWCKRMDATTYVDAGVVTYMNQNFYAVRLDAETRDTIAFRDKKFVFRPEYKANELALSLMGGQMSYPTVIYLDEKLNLLGPSPGYQTTEQLIPQLKYFGENIYRDKTWDIYQKEVFSH